MNSYTSCFCCLQRGESDLDGTLLNSWSYSTSLLDLALPDETYNSFRRMSDTRHPPTPHIENLKECFCHGISWTLRLEGWFGTLRSFICCGLLLSCFGCGCRHSRTLTALRLATIGKDFSSEIPSVGYENCLCGRGGCFLLRDHRPPPGPSETKTDSFASHWRWSWFSQWTQFLSSPLFSSVAYFIGWHIAFGESKLVVIQGFILGIYFGAINLSWGSFNSSASSLLTNSFFSFETNCLFMSHPLYGLNYQPFSLFNY